MKRRIISFILILTLCVSVFSGLDLSGFVADAAEINKWGDYEYSVNLRGEVTIRYYMGKDREVTIPSQIDGKPVTEIGDYSFNGFNRLISHEEGFENHPNEWYNSRIRKVVIPSTVKKTGEYAFANMDRLNEIVFSEGLEEIGQFAFYNCPGLKTIKLPDSLKTFNLLSFEETAIEEIVLGSETEGLNLETRENSKVRKIICNADNVYFGRVNFEGSSVLEEIVINGNLGGGFRNRKTPIKRVVCNGDADFNSILDMRSAGFEFCSDADGNNIVFSKIESDFNKTYDSGDFRYRLNENNEAVITRYIGGKSHVVVPSSLDGYKVTAIATLSFACMKSGGIFADDRYIAEDLLVSVSLPETIRTIGKFAFAENLSLEKINIPSGVEIIPEKCFLSCESLKGIVLPETVTEIGENAFRYCENLERIEMPAVEKIGEYAFYFCRKLSDAVYSEKLREVGAGAFYDCNLTGILDLSSVIKIGSDAFDSTDISRVILNDNLERLEYGVFQSCTLLEEINFPSKLVSIGESCFRGTGINKAVFNEGLKEIGALAFDMCKELYIMELPESIEKIGNYAFERTLLEIVVIPENLKIIGYRAFGYCTELEILYFNARNCTVDFEQNYMDESDDLGNAPPFIGCNLREIYLGEGVTSIGGYSAPFGTFENCSALESIMIPDTVSEIGTAAFKNCSALETAVIPGSVSRIADDAFDGCDNLTILCFADSYVHSYAQTNGIRVSTFVVAPIPNQTYTGHEITPEVSVSFSGDTLHKNIDFGVSYANNINAGKADVTVKGKGNYKNFSNTVKFAIVPKSISSAAVADIADQPYTGSAVTPELIVTDGAKLLCADKDYTASYSNNKSEGTATVKITGIGNYSGSISSEFRIVKMDGGESFFSRLFSEIELFLAKISSFFSQIFNFI